MEEEKKESFMEKHFWDYLNQKKEIKLNLESIPIIVFCLAIIFPLAKIREYIMLLKPSLFLNIITFIFSFLALVYSIFKRKIILVIFFLLATIAFLVNIFYPIIK